MTIYVDVLSMPKSTLSFIQGANQVTVLLSEMRNELDEETISDLKRIRLAYIKGAIQYSKQPNHLIGEKTS